jgi:WD40 repeat protein
LALLFLIWYWVGQVTLVIDWPTGDRNDAAGLVVNGRRIDVSTGDSFSVAGRSGDWDLQMSRAGYEPIRETLRMTFGEHRSYVPHWRPTAKTARLHELGHLERRAEPLQDARPDNGPLLQLRQDLILFGCRNALNDESSAAAALLAKLPAPLDRLKRENNPAAEMRLAGLGDPAHAPRELVGIIGTGAGRFWNRPLSVTASHDGDWIAAASLDGTVRISDRQNPGETQILQLSNEPQEVLFSPVDSTLAIAGSRREVTLWRIQDGVWSLVTTLRGTEAPLAFSGDGRWIAAHGRRNEIILCDASSGAIRRRVTTLPRATVRRLVLNADGESLAAECRDDSVVVWNLSGSDDPVRLPRTIAPRFHPDGRTLAAGALDGDLQLRSATTGTVERTFELGGTPLGFTGDGGTLVSYRNGRVVVWDVQTGAAQRTLVDVPPLTQLNRSGEKLVAASEVVGDLRLWDLRTGTELMAKRVPAPFTALAWIADSSRIVSTDTSFTIREWDSTTGEETSPVSPAWGAVAVHPEGTRVAIAAEGRVRLQGWDESTTEPVLLEGSTPELSSLAWSPDGRWIAGAGGPGFFGASLRLWDATRGREVAVELDQPGLIRALEFSPSGQRLAIAGDSPFVTLWDMSRGSVQERLELFPDRIGALAFNRPRRMLAGAGRDGKLFAWDLFSHSGVTFENPSRMAIHQLAFTPGKNRLAAATDGGIVLWDAESGQRLRTLIGKPGEVLTLRFSPAGDRLAAAGSSGKVWLWDWPDSELPRETPDETISIGPGGGIISRLFWSVDDRHLLTVNGNSTIYALRLARE